MARAWALIESLQQYHLYDDKMRTELIATLEANRALGFFGNPNHLAGYLVLGLWVMYYLYTQVRNRWLHLVLGVLSLFILFTVYRTFSRSGLLAVVLSLMLLMIIPWLESWNRRKLVILLAGLVLFSMVLGCIVCFLPSGFLGGRLTTISTIVARMHFYRGAVHVIQDSPLWGVGPEGFEGYYAAYIRPGDLEARYVHNILLETAVEAE